MNRSIRSQILLIAIAPLLVMGLIGLVSVATSRHLLLDERLEQQGLAAASYIAIASEYGLLAGDAQALASVARHALADGQIAAVTIEDAAGRQVVQLTRPGASTLRTVEVVRPIHVWDRVGSEGTESLIGQTRILLDVAPTRRAQITAIAFSAGLMMVLLALAGYASVRLFRNIAAPVSRIIEAMHAIEEGHLETRVAETAGNELARMERGINRMAHALQTHRDDLEHHVRAATGEYIRANEELERHNEQLAEARSAAEAATRAKSAFLANMSHEIRTPLNSIVGYTQLIRREQSTLPEKVRDHVGNIAIASSTLLELVNELLDFSRIEAGCITQSIESLDLTELLDEVAATLCQQARDKDLYVDVVPYLDVPRRLIGDRAHLHQVLTNLLANAIKFTQRGGVVIRAMTESEPNEETLTLRFEVQDSGKGIAPEDLRRLFLPFEQLDDSMARVHQGTGLGLAICKGLVEMMGGEIGVESDGPGRGSTFWFSVPMHRSAGAADTPQPHPGRFAVVDERSSFRQMVMGHLHDLGIAVTPVSDLSEIQPATAKLNAIFVRWRADGTSLQRLTEAALPLAERVVVCGLDPDSPQTERLRQRGALFIPAPVRTRTLLQVLGPILALPDRVEAYLTAAHRPRPLSGACILVVDDNTLNRTFLAEMLSIHGPEIVQAESGAEALRLLLDRALPADLVLMDLHMPGMDGRQTTRALRAAGIEVPVIAVTANALPETREAVVSAGMDDLVTKPVEEQKLLEAICRRFPCPEAPQASPVDETAALRSDLARLFRQEGGKYLGQLDALVLGDPERVRHLAHTISGAAATCYLNEVAEIARELEMAARRGAGADELGSLRAQLRHSLVEACGENTATEVAI